jgi:hypothetical protein
VFLACATGGFLFIECADAIYEVHTQFLPEGRGPGVLHMARQAVGYMFTETPCLAIRTFVSDNNEAARKLTFAVGFKEAGRVDVFGSEVMSYLFTVKDWARSLCQHGYP